MRMTYAFPLCTEWEEVAVGLQRYITEILFILGV